MKLADSTLNAGKGASPAPSRRESLRISIRVHSHLKYTDLFHTVLAQVALEIPIPPERMDWVALALREAVNNAVLHGNKKEPSKWIEVEMVGTPGAFTMTVWDEGPGFNTSQLSDPRDPENLLKPNGRGIFLIRQFTDKVQFVRDADGRFGLVMTVHLTERGPKEEPE
jgi:serine/threonine-protein kinase RsbW